MGVAVGHLPVVDTGEWPGSQGGEGRGGRRGLAVDMHCARSDGGLRLLTGEETRRFCVRHEHDDGPTVQRYAPDS